METTNQNTWNDDLNNQGQGNGSTSFGTPDNGDTTNRNYSDDVNQSSGMDKDTLEGNDSVGNIPGSYSSNESMSGANSPDGDNELDADEDLDTEDDLAGEGDDVDEGYDENELDDTEGGGNTSTAYAATGSGYDNNPDEIPEERESDNEGTGYSTQTEINQPQEGADTSYSEQNDVTPPNQHEFPSEGAATKTDFASRPQGRTTGRMLGHEPGTEGI